jgi:hypothetical protein
MSAVTQFHLETAAAELEQAEQDPAAALGARRDDEAADDRIRSAPERLRAVHARHSAARTGFSTSPTA